MILAEILAPVIAVQVQKFLEQNREEHERKVVVFKTVMAKRASTNSPNHVEALNMIDLEFHDKKYKNVKLAWKTYLDHLGNFPNDDEQLQPVWVDKRIDLLARLLLEMGKSLDYDFDEVHIKKGIYSPEAHARVEEENTLLRKGLLGLLDGNKALKIDIQSFPITEEDVKEQKEIRKGIQDILSGKSTLPVSVNEK